MADAKKKKKKIIAGIVGSAALIGGTTGGILATVETEEKTEENEEEKPSNNPVKKVPLEEPNDDRVELSSVLKKSQRDLGTIETNGQELTQEMIKEKLPNISWDEVTLTFDIYKITSSGSVRIGPTENSTKYKGGPVTVSYRLDTRQTLDSALPSSERDLRIIETNGLPITEQEIKAKLESKGIDPSQVVVKVNSNTEASVRPIQGSTKYKGNAIRLSYTVDSRIDLASKLSGWQPTIIAGISEQLTNIEFKQQINNQLKREGIDIDEIHIVGGNNSAKNFEIKVNTNSKKYKNNYLNHYRLETRSNSLPVLPQNQSNFETTVRLINNFLASKTVPITMSSRGNTKEKVLEKIVEEVKKYLRDKRKPNGDLLVDDSFSFSHTNNASFLKSGKEIFNSFTTKINNKKLTVIIILSDGPDRRVLDVNISLTLT